MVYGHTPVPEAEWLNNTIDIDTGCVFGGQLTALRYPEREVNALLAVWHPDTAALRRYLVDEGLLSRDAGVYWRSGGTVEV